MKQLFFSLVVFSLFSPFYTFVMKSHAAITLPTPSAPIIEVGESSSFLLEWEEPLGIDIAGYRLYRSEDDFNYFSVQEDLIRTTSYVDSLLNREKLYYYRISVVDSEGNESPLSNSASEVLNRYILDENMLENSHFDNELDGWSVGLHEEVQTNMNSEWSKVVPVTVNDGYNGTIKVAGQNVTGTGKAVKFLLQEGNQKAKTTLYQRKFEVVPTGKSVQLSFAWKKNCDCEAANVQSTTKINDPKQILRVELVRPDSTWVTLWEHNAIAKMDDYALVENLDITEYVTQSGTYDFRVITELATAYEDMDARNEIWLDEMFLSLEEGPSPVKDVKVDVVNEGGALLITWIDQNEDVDGFDVYRSTDVTGPFIRLNDQLIQDKQYMDTGLQNGLMYYYQIKAVDSEIESIGSRPVRGVPVYIDPINHPHHSYNENTSACATCHITHKSRSKKMIKESTEAATCLTCHNGTGSRYDTNSQFSENDSSSHPVVGTPLAASGELQCSSCHNPHATNGTRATPPQVNGSLAQKSGVNVKYNDTPFTDPISISVKENIEKEEQLCFSCHSSNSNQPIKTEATSISKEFHPANASAHRSDSSSIVGGIGGYVNGWSATTAVKCTDCHGSANSENHEGVHGSEYENVLKKEFTIQTVGTDQNVLCFECHDQATYGGNTNKDSSKNDIGITRFKKKPESTKAGETNQGINLHNYWNERSNRGHLGVACAQCHSAVPHSSEKYPALLVDLDDPEPYQHYQENTNVKIYYPADGAWTQNSCGTVGAGCHNNTR